MLAKVILSHPENDRHRRAPKLAELNLLVDSFAAGEATTRSPVFVVDHTVAFDPLIHTEADGVHPNPAGEAVMAQTWFTALQTHVLSTTGVAAPASCARGGYMCPVSLGSVNQSFSLSGRVARNPPALNAPMLFVTGGQPYATGALAPLHRPARAE